MGLFGGLFDKKVCDLCGGEIGLLGNRKLEDGNCCKQCAAKLSPWFSERRHSTLAEIRQQLNWQTIVLNYNDEGPIKFSKLRIYIEDNDRNGEIYIDSINFI